MDDVYLRLAAKLDQLPHGFPSTASGVDLRILRHIFAPAEAEMAVHLLPLPETAEAIAARLSRPVVEVRPFLDAMVGRGLISATMVQGEKRFGLAPFVIGIYEWQLPRMDAELAEMCEEYFPALVGAVGGYKPAIARVVPVNTHIEAQAQVLAFEDIRARMSAARSFNLQPCLCRTERAALGKACSHPIETCMVFSTKENAFEGTLPTGFGRRVSREEALAVLDLAEREGLVHCTYNVRQDQAFVCNCCSCCCGFLRAVKELDAPHMLVRSNWVSAIDADRCTACGECAAPRCPMDAVAEHDGAFAVDEDRCLGCGACTAVCPTDAVTLKPRPRSQQTTPPKTIVSWALRRAIRRSGPLRAIAQVGSLTGTALASQRSARRTRRRQP